MVKVEHPSSYTDIGKQALEKASKINTDRVEVRELSKEINKDYMTTLMEIAQKDKHKYEGSYYVVVLTKRERLVQRVIRNLFFTKQACPTPSYEQAVYMFNPETDTLEFLWIVPSRNICNIMYQQRHFVELQSDPLLPYVVDFIEGKLLLTAKRLNKEEEN